MADEHAGQGPQARVSLGPSDVDYGVQWKHATDGLSLSAVLADDCPADAIEDGVGHQRLGRVSVVTLALPEALNALRYASWRRISALCEDIEAASEVRAVIVRGAGKRAFGAGADISEFPALRSTARQALVYNGAIRAALEGLMRLSVPVVAMVRGFAVGGGCELAAACDVRVADATARFGIPVGRLGVTLGVTEANAVARLIGPAALKYLLFSGRLIDADEAARLGLVQVVVDSEQLIPETVALIAAIVSSSEVTMRAAKVVTQMCERPLTADDAEQLTRTATEAYDGPDLKEGVAAFLERRTPHFTMERNRSDGGS